MAAPLRGEIWMVAFDPTRGHEQAGTRPALVLSASAFNAGPSGLVVVVPLTTRQRGVRWHVSVDPPEGGLRRRSYIKCEDVRSISIERLSRRLGVVGRATLDAVSYRVRVLLEL
ncbi:MAG: type II toxin-antitoxin system PemK/MazF family toxin [Planctomycetia bacterium]|nr:type II toxin-antitoxin system PemK/MazF family toxin [Planctomycetia bacterium]